MVIVWQFREGRAGAETREILPTLQLCTLTVNWMYGYCGISWLGGMRGVYRRVKGQK